MANGAVQFKAFLRDENSVEARRFSIDDPSIAFSYICMKEKLQHIYPVLEEVIFKITWKDDDGDEITITSDEDLITAITEMTDKVKVLYLTVLEDGKMPEIDAHEEPNESCRGQVICDGCETKIRGYRYKCIQCTDYDLCMRCEHGGLHSEHMMIRVPNSEVYVPRCARRIANHFNRYLKKVQINASKEAYRAHKFNTKDRNEKSGDKSAEEPRASTSRRCPMESHLPNLGNVGEMMSGVPFMDIFNPGTQATPFADAVRKAINTFFEGISQQPGTQSAAQSNEATAQEKTTAETASNSSSVPMDVEHNIDEQKNEADTSQKLPGWTFLNSNNMNEPKEQNKIEDPKIADGLVQLLEMGFSDDAALVSLLKRFDGNVAKVVKYLFEQH